MERLQANYPVDVHWRSFELRPAGSPPMPPEYRQRIEASRPRLLQIARDQYGLDLNPGPMGINSRPALILAKAAEAQGKGEAYRKAVMRAYWQAGKSIADEDVLTEVLGEAGMNPADLHTLLENPAYNAAVAADVEQAYAYGLTGVPALIFAGKYLVSGAQPYEVLTQVVEEVAAREQQ
ncbi:MAG: DsbA family protein [Anaerolineae bacterium]|nr:DsbA family protein [Anaerolineae bacterium]